MKELMPDKKLNMFSQAFALLMLLACLITSVPFLHFKYGPYVKVVLVFGLLICGGYLLFGNLLKTIKSSANVFLCAFLVSYIITIIINRDISFKENISQLIYMTVFFVLFVFVKQRLTKEELEKEFTLISTIIVITTFFFALISYWTYKANYYDYYLDPINPNIGYPLGFNSDGLYGLYNPNVCGMYAALSIFLTLGLIYKLLACDSKRVNLVYKLIFVLFGFANIVVEYKCLTLSLSRTSIYALYITIVLLVIIVLAWFFRKKKYSNGMAMFALFAPVTFGDGSTVSNIIEFMITHIGDLSKREILWINGWNAFIEKPMLGRTNGYIVSSLSENSGGLHNIYLTVLVASGLLGFVFAAATVIVVLYKAVYCLVKSKSVNPSFAVSALLVVFVLITEFFESRIFYTVGIFNVIFWIYFGYTLAFADLQIKEIKEQK